MDLKIYWKEEAVGKYLKYFIESKGVVNWIIIVIIKVYLFFARAALIIWKIKISWNIPPHIYSELDFRLYTLMIRKIPVMAFDWTKSNFVNLKRETLLIIIKL